MTDDLLQQMMDDSMKIVDMTAATDATSALDEVARLAFEQIQLEDEVEMLELAVAEKKEQLRTIQEQKLPTAMASAGIKNFTTKGGFKIAVKPYYSASIKGENEAECFAWLREHGHDDIIKNEIKTTFGRGEDDKAQLVVDALSTLGIPCTNKKSVHPQTLSAFVRERVESADPTFPHTTFNVFIGQKAKITRSK
jgi:hypothetical protein